MTSMQFSHLHSNKLSHTLLQTPTVNIATLKPINFEMYLNCFKQFIVFTYLTPKAFGGHLYKTQYGY